MKSIFISYDHDDQDSRRDVESIRCNRNNLIEFHDRSLNEPVFNDFGHINRRLPSDSASERVRAVIKEKLYESSKLLVLIGQNTHSSEWVKWEIETFKSIKRAPDIFFMRVKDDHTSMLARDIIPRHLVKDWNMSELSDWLR